MHVGIYSITPLPCSNAPLSWTNLHRFCLVVITTKSRWSPLIPEHPPHQKREPWVHLPPFTHQRQATVWWSCTFFCQEFAGWKLTPVCCLLRCFCELLLQKASLFFLFFPLHQLRDGIRSLTAPAYPVIFQKQWLKREQRGYIVTRGVLQQKAPRRREKSYCTVILCEGGGYWLAALHIMLLLF